MVNLLELQEKENLLGFDNVTLSQLVANGKLVHIDNCDKMAQSGKWANDIRGGAIGITESVKPTILF